MVGIGAVPAAAIAALMGSDPLALVEELHRAAGGPDVHLLADQPIGHAVEEALVLDVVVGAGPGQPPLGVLVVLGRKRRELRPLDGVEQLAAGDAQAAEAVIVDPVHGAGDGGVGFGQREEPLVAQATQDAGLGEADPVLHLRLIPRPPRARRQHAYAIMRRHHGEAAVDLRIVEGGLVDPALQVVRHDQARDAAKEAEHADVRANPVRQGLGPGRLGEGIVGGAQHGDEDLRLSDLACVRIVDRQLLARVVDKDLVARDVVLAHGRRKPPLEAPEKIAEPAVAIAVGLRRPVLLPQHHHGDARLLQLHHQRRPAGLSTPPCARLHTRSREQPLLQQLVGQLRRQRPAHLRGLRPLQAILHRAAHHAGQAPDLTHARARTRQAQHLPQLSHGQRPLRRHAVLPSPSTEPSCPQLLTQEPASLLRAAGY